MKHTFRPQVYTPASVIVRCTCGWSAQQSRAQNAFARAAKLRKAINRHAREIAEKEASK